MPLPVSKSPLIKYGWIRALLLLMVYAGLSLGAAVAIDDWLPVSSMRADGQGGAFNNLSLQIWLTVSFVIAVAAVLFFTRFIDRKGISRLGLLSINKFHPWGTIGCLLGIFLTCAGALILYFTHSAEWTDISFDGAELMISLLLLLFVAIAEELVFRGYILVNLMDSMNKWIALLISAALFALMHSENPGAEPIALCNVFLAGLLTGISYLYTRTLWFALGWHLCWNFFEGPVLGFKVSGLSVNSLLVLETEGNRLLTGGDFGFEASLICTGLLLTAIGLLGYAAAAPPQRVTESHL